MLKKNRSRFALKLVNEKHNCCGCGLCAIECPKKAITMKEDEYGFIYPYIDETKCINCNVCKKVCNYKTSPNNDFSKKAYVAFAKEDRVLSTTASGGAFTALAESFLKNGGVVFGCSLESCDKGFEVKHIKVDNEKELEKLKGSKYIQSDITKIYSEVKDELNKGKKVLFSGTPCQISAIKAFTHQHENLYTIGIICHGGPSNRMFNDFINFLETKKKIKINNFVFRDKTKGWGLYAKIYYLKNNKPKSKIIPYTFLSYYQLFIDAVTYRENCFSCHFASANRVEDITLGDFWGIEYEHPEYIKNKLVDSKKGISCLIVNSYKGENLLSTYSNEIVLLESSFDKMKKHNKNLYEPSVLNPKREELLHLYVSDGYSAVDSWQKKNNKIKTVIRSIWLKIPYDIRLIIKTCVKSVSFKH